MSPLETQAQAFARVHLAASGTTPQRLREALLEMLVTVRREALAEAATVAERRAERWTDRDAAAEARRIARQLRARARKAA